MTAFDREEFLAAVRRQVWGSRIADEFERLHAEIERLKAPPVPPRETGWAVVLDGQLTTVLVASKERAAFTPVCAALTTGIHWLGCRADAEALARLLCIGRAAELDKETLKEVQLPKAEEQKEPPRETGWAVVDKGGGALQFSDDDGVRRVRWFDSRAEAATLSQMLGVGRAAELYKDTLEEVEA